MKFNFMDWFKKNRENGKKWPSGGKYEPPKTVQDELFEEILDTRMGKKQNAVVLGEFIWAWPDLRNHLFCSFSRYEFFKGLIGVLVEGRLYRTGDIKISPVKELGNDIAYFVDENRKVHSLFFKPEFVGV
jgi:hypothetical protein